MLNSIDPDEMAHFELWSMLFAKAYYYCLRQWKSKPLTLTAMRQIVANDILLFLLIYLFLFANVKK